MVWKGRGLIGEALVKNLKEVLVIDLNPLSRTARMATVTVVDEVSRASKEIFKQVSMNNYSPSKWDNISALNESLKIISSSFIGDSNLQNSD